MSNGLDKNIDVLKEEWQEVGADFKWNISRLKKPSLNPKNREHFVPHVLVAFVSTFYSLRRTLTYATVAGIIVYSGVAVFNLLSTA